ncbi:hypothetical protein ACROYT_G006223 [Oculina patagonica]
MSSANVLPSAPAYGDREETQLYPSLPTNAENFRLTEISKIEKEISAEAEHYRLVLKKYKKVRKVIHYSVVCLGAVTAALSSGAVATSLTGVGIVIGVPVAAVAGSRILTLTDTPEDQMYKLKLKGISICFSMLKAALCGGYVNFGVFGLYGDDALEKALKTFVELLSSIPHSNLLEYPKLSQSYYGLLEILAQDHMNFLSSLEPQVFMYILSSILEGLTALDIMVCTGCCGTLDFVVTHLFKMLSKRRKKNPTGMDAQPPCLSHPEMIQQMLSTVLNIVMFEDCKNQWSMSRPLLGLILLNEKYFQELQRNVIAMQPPEKQEDMAQCFRNLMEGVEPSLITKNRDRFTQNLSIFRREVNNSLKAPTNGSGVVKSEGGVDMVA